MIKKVGITIYREFVKDSPLTDAQKRGLVDQSSAEGARELEALLADGYAVLSFGVVSVPGLTFMMHILYKPDTWTTNTPPSQPSA